MPKFRCEHCRQKIAAPDDYVGRRVRCPRCKQPVRVPEVVEAAAVAATPPATVMPAVAPTTSPAPAAERSTPKATPSAAPFAREHRDEVFSRRSDADLSALFGDSPGEGTSPNDLAPEEQTQVFWQMHQVAEHHDPPPPPMPPATATPAGDFFEQPADEAPAGARPPPEAAHRMAREPEPEPDPPPAPVPEPMVVEPAEVIDAPVRRPRRGLNSAHEVADLLRRLDKPQQRARLAAEWVADVQQRTAPRGSRWIGVLGWASLAAGGGAVALSFLPAQARFAAPAGVAGLLMALVALVLAMGKRANVLAAMGGALISAGGVVVAVLVARGVLPPNAAARLVGSGSTPPVTLALDSRPAGPSDEHVEYVPATSPLIVGNVEVRVASARVLRPAIYTGDYGSLHTAGERRLQITLELKRVGAGSAPYEPWRKRADGDAEPRATDAAGAVFPIDERPFVEGEDPVTLPFGALRGTTALGPQPISDALLFDAPADPSGDVLLDLPGENIGAPAGATLHIRVPAAMIRVQR